MSVDIFPNPSNDLLKVEAFIGLLNDEQLKQLCERARRGQLVYEDWGDGEKTACLTVAPLPPDIAHEVLEAWNSIDNDEPLPPSLAKELDGTITDELITTVYKAWDGLDDGRDEGPSEREHVIKWLSLGEN